MAAAGGSAPGRQPATAHVQTRIALCKTLLHMQQQFVMAGSRTFEWLGLLPLLFRLEVSDSKYLNAAAIRANSQHLAIGGKCYRPEIASH